MTLQPHHFESLATIKGGADVFSRTVVGDLREVKRLHPGWLTFSAPLKRYRSIDKYPFFGATLTPAGVKAVEENLPTGSPWFLF